MAGSYGPGVDITAPGGGGGIRKSGFDYQLLEKGNSEEILRTLKVWLPVGLSDQKFWPGKKATGTDVNILATCSVSFYSEEGLCIPHGNPYGVLVSFPITVIKQKLSLK